MIIIEKRIKNFDLAENRVLGLLRLGANFQDGGFSTWRFRKRAPFGRIFPDFFFLRIFLTNNLKINPNTNPNINPIIIIIIIIIIIVIKIRRPKGEALEPLRRPTAGQ